METFTYHFNLIHSCNMCQTPEKKFKILGRRLNHPQRYNPRQVAGIATTIMKCGHCGLVFSNPQPVPESLQDHYKIDPAEYWKESYFKPDDQYFGREIETTKKLMGSLAGKKALDIGAGIGKCMHALTRAGFESYGIEPSETFLI